MTARISNLIARLASRRERAAHAITAIELRANRLLAARLEQDGATRACSLDCAPSARRPRLEQLRREHWFDGARVTLMLGPGQRQLNSTPKPPVDDQELREAVRWQLRDALDYPPEEAVIDVLPVASTEPIGRAEVLVFSTRRTELQTLLQDFKTARINIRTVATIDCAQRNLAWHWVAEPGATALLMPCDGGALCTVSIGEQLVFSRTIDIGSDLVAGTRRFEQAAERIALQLQRSFDLLERRSADAAITQLVIADWGPAAALFMRVAALTAQRTRAFELPRDFDGQSSADASVNTLDCLHLLGACLDTSPADQRASRLRSIAMPGDAHDAPLVDGQPVRAASLDFESDSLRAEVIALEAQVVQAQLSQQPAPALHPEALQPLPLLAAAPEQSPDGATPAGPDSNGLLLIDPQQALAEELRNLAQARADAASNAASNAAADGNGTSKLLSPNPAANRTATRLELLP